MDRTKSEYIFFKAQLNIKVQKLSYKHVELRLKLVRFNIDVNLCDKVDWRKVKVGL